MSERKETTTRRSRTTETSMKVDRGLFLDDGLTLSSQPAHNVVVWRTTAAVPPGPSSVDSLGSTTFSRAIRTSLEAGSGVSDFEPGTYQMATKITLKGVRDSHVVEQSKMKDLNERFAGCLDKIQALEEQNRRLAVELSQLKLRWGQETEKLKANYDVELDEARDSLDLVDVVLARLKINNAFAEEKCDDRRTDLSFLAAEITKNKETFEANKKRLKDYEKEVGLLRKHYETVGTERASDKDTIRKLKKDIVKVRKSLNTATLNYIRTENKRKTLEEKIDFLKSVHVQEMKELAVLYSTGSYDKDEEFWTTQIQLAIHEIEKMYSQKIELSRAEIRSSVERKLATLGPKARMPDMDDLTLVKKELSSLRQEITSIQEQIRLKQTANLQLTARLESLRRDKERTERMLIAENTELRVQMSENQSQLDSILLQIESVSNDKVGLEIEIEAYQKLLDGIEGQTSEWSSLLHESTDNQKPVKPARLTTVTTQQDEQDSINEPGSRAEGTSVLRARTAFKRNAKGSIAVTDCPPDGRLVSLQNTGKKVKDIRGWKITRKVDGTVQPDYILDDRFSVVAPGTKIGIYAKGAKSTNAGEHDFEISRASWGVGMNIATKIFNTKGDERASLVQETTYS